jgi:hypothetical protein
MRCGLVIVNNFKQWYKSFIKSWIYFKYDRNLYSDKIFHIGIQWFVCDSWLIDDFVTLLYRRCGRFGVRLCQTPSYFNSDNLDIHPFRPAPYIYLAHPAPTALPFPPLLLRSQLLFVLFLLLPIVIITVVVFFHR